jgi:IS30 family transposase
MVLPNENVTGGIMSVDDPMTVDERRKYLRKMQKRYQKADRAEKTKLLDEMQDVTGMHRKSLTRLLSGSLERKSRRRQRGRTYGPEVVSALSAISESLDYICAERLQPSLVWMAQHLSHHGELQLSSSLQSKLACVSVSTVRRLLKDQPRDLPRLPRKKPERANRLMREIPARRIPWQEKKPGHFETDLVHHCGVSASGHYVHTLQIIDVATGWSERVAVLGRSSLVLRDAFQRILARLPFPLLEIHPDNGSEFLNYHLLDFWKERASHVQLSRSRPWQKNDNRFVEQKNDTLVRSYLGYDRLDTVEQTNLLNELYEHMWLYYNFFQPVLRLEEKVVSPIEGQPSNVKRRFDAARTPFDRLCQTDAISCEEAARLTTLRSSINPRQLRKEIYSLLERLFSLPNAEPGSIQDVYDTLFATPDFMKGEDRSVTLSIDGTISAQ